MTRPHTYSEKIDQISKYPDEYFEILDQFHTKGECRLPFSSPQEANSARQQFYEFLSILRQNAGTNEIARSYSEKIRYLTLRVASFSNRVELIFSGNPIVSAFKKAKEEEKKQLPLEAENVQIKLPRRSKKRKVRDEKEPS